MPGSPGYGLHQAATTCTRSGGYLRDVSSIALRRAASSLVRAASSALPDLAEVQLPHAERHGHDTNPRRAIRPHGTFAAPDRCAFSERTRPARERIRPQSLLPATPRVVPGRLAASPLTRQKSPPAHDDGGPVQQTASHVWQSRLPQSARPGRAGCRTPAARSRLTAATATPMCTSTREGATCRHGRAGSATSDRSCSSGRSRR